MEAIDEFLITRKQAAKRYNLPQRALDELYRQNPDFPSLKVGRRVMIIRDKADAYFTRHIRDEIEYNR